MAPAIELKGVWRTIWDFMVRGRLGGGGWHGGTAPCTGSGGSPAGFPSGVLVVTLTFPSFSACGASALSVDVSGVGSGMNGAMAAPAGTGTR